MAGVNSERKPAAVLWDFDGTLLDSEKIWIMAEAEALGAYGVAWSYEQGVALCGTPWDVSTAAMLAEAERQLGQPLDVDPLDLYEVTYQRVVQHLLNDGLPWLPGARELLDDCREQGVPMAIVSASPLELLEAGTSQMPPGSFQVVVPGTEVPRSKPAPDGYLMAAERLGVAASDCVVIEDSNPGTAAGRAAGAAVIAVPSMHPLETAPGQLNLDSLAGLDYAGLGRIWHELKGGDDE